MSNDRKGHYLKPGVRPSAPGVVICVTIDTVADAVADARGATVQRFARAHISRAIYRRGQWESVVRCESGTPGAALSAIESMGVQGRTNWVVTPHLSDTLTLLEWWHDLESAGCVWCRAEDSGQVRTPHIDSGDPYLLDSLVIRSGFGLAQWRRKGVRWRWVDGLNLLPAGIDTAGLPGDAAPIGRGGCRTIPPRPRGAPDTSADRWLLAVTALADWWRTVARAPMGTSLGQLAVGLLRSHIPAKALCTHSDCDAHRLERSAAHGGRASVWYVGSIGRGDGRVNVGSHTDQGQRERTISGGVTHYDIRSMYPALLRDMQFPVKLKSYRERVPPDEPAALAEQWGVIARCTIETRVPEYPYRDGGYVTYPIGRFTTSLTGPELLQLRHDGRVVACHAMAVYTLGRPFSGAASAMLDMRQEARDRRDSQQEGWVKLVSNSLAGKLAQRQGGWRRVPEMDSPGQWGEEWSLPADGGAPIRYRYLAGLCWQWIDDKDGRGPYTFAFAYLSAYGRLAMRRIRDTLPERSVVSQDTDGLWALSHAVPHLDQLVADGNGAPGHLRRVCHATDARWYTPRHYYYDGHWVLAGFASPLVDTERGMIHDLYRHSVWGQRANQAPDGAVMCLRESPMPTDVRAGDVDRDGWVIPSRVKRKKG